MSRVHRLRPLGSGHPFETAEYIPYYYATSPFVRHYFHRRLHDALSLIEDQDLHVTDVALDLGCFVGLMTMSLVDQYRLAVGIDVDPEYLTMAKELSEYEQKSSACFVQADAFALPFKEASIGTVTAISLFEHLPDSRIPFREIRRVLRSGGTLVAGLPIEIGIPFLIKQLFFRLVRWVRQDPVSLGRVLATFFYGESHGPEWKSGHLDYNWRRSLRHIQSCLQVRRLRFWPMRAFKELASVHVTVHADKL